MSITVAASGTLPGRRGWHWVEQGAQGRRNTMVRRPGGGERNGKSARESLLAPAPFSLDVGLDPHAITALT